MIYTPSKNPREAFMLISIIVFGGIIISVLSTAFFAVVALLFWMQYTAVLSYIQFVKKKKHKVKNLTTLLLNPQFRFFIFIFIAVVGLFSIFYISPIIAYAALFVWWLFSWNFYRHYREFKNKN